MKTFLFAIILISTLLLSACGQKQTQLATQPADSGSGGIGVPVSVSGSGTYMNVSVPELQAMLETKDFTFVNVHIPFEGDIPETDLSIPYDEIEQHLDQLPGEKDAKIVLYCRSDRMSNIAAEKLVQLGYTNVWNLEGGFNEWENAGLPMEK